MGAGGEKKGLHEIAETKASLRDDAFEAILDRIESSGGEITSDEESPLYTDIGADEFEVGTERMIEFSLNKIDFQLSRKVETHKLSGAGRQKHLEALETPRIYISLKRRLGYSSDWQVVDLEDMF